MSEYLGLDNIGNTCFMNSALQCLRHVFPLTEYLLAINSYNKNSLLYEYISLLRNFYSGKNMRSINPYSFKNIFENYYPKYRGSEQHDSGEFLSSLLAILNNELEKFNQYEIDNYGKKNTIIDQLFLTLTRPIIDNDPQEIEPNYIINLPVVDSYGNELRTLEECLYEFQKSKQIKGNFNGTMSTKICSISDYVILNLNRVRKGYHYSNMIEYPEFLNINNIKYRLIALIKHRGNQHSGHKIAICRDEEDNWHEYNDSIHTPIGGFPKSQDLAFLFIYERTGSVVRKTKSKTTNKNVKKEKDKKNTKIKKKTQNEEESEEYEEEEEVDDNKVNDEIKELIKKSELDFESINKNKNKTKKDETKANLDKLYGLIYSNCKLEKFKDLLKLIDSCSKGAVDENGCISLNNIIGFLEALEIPLKEIKIDLFQAFKNYDEYIENYKIAKLSKDTIKKEFKKLKKKLDEKKFKNAKEFSEAKTYTSSVLIALLNNMKIKVTENVILSIKKNIKSPVTLRKFYEILENMAK